MSDERKIKVGKPLSLANMKAKTVHHQQDEGNYRKETLMGKNQDACVTETFN